jgi:hypothetical protein
MHHIDKFIRYYADPFNFGRKKKEMKSAFYISTIAAIFLSACGGGGGDSADTQPAVIVAPDVADQFTGKYVSECFGNSEVTESGTTKLVNNIEEITVTKAAASTSGYAIKTTFYASADVTCTGTPLAVQTNSSASNKVTYAGAAKVTLNGSAVQGQKIDVVRGPVGGLSAGKTVTINNLTYPGDYFVRTLTYKSLFYLAGGKLYFGYEPLDSQGYPTVVDPTPSYTRQ